MFDIVSLIFFSAACRRFAVRHALKISFVQNLDSQSNIEIIHILFFHQTKRGGSELTLAIACSTKNASNVKYTHTCREI